MEEIWKDVIGYEGLYQVSSLGRVKSLNYGQTGQEKILKPNNHNLGYIVVGLHKEGLQKSKKIHQLEAEAFIDKDYKSKGLVVNHINFKRNDNRLCNLEVVTQRENTNCKHLVSSSKYTGVCWHKRYKKWSSRIFIDGKSKYLGFFDNEKEASDYYEAALICVNEGRFDDILAKKKNTSSKYKGVNFDKISNKWRSRYEKNHIRKHIGYFSTEEDAKIALDNYKNEKMQSL
jgi:hypothetical protein